MIVFDKIQGFLLSRYNGHHEQRYEYVNIFKLKRLKLLDQINWMSISNWGNTIEYVFRINQFRYVQWLCFFAHILKFENQQNNLIKF